MDHAIARGPSEQCLDSVQSCVLLGELLARSPRRSDPTEDCRLDVVRLALARLEQRHVRQLLEAL
eukprot:4702287-Heterocapsa_arctica.AAC.1